MARSFDHPLQQITGIVFHIKVSNGSIKEGTQKNLKVHVSVHAHILSGRILPLGWWLPVKHGMSDLFDFLGCTSLFSSKSSTVSARKPHPQRHPARIPIPSSSGTDTQSASSHHVSAVATPHMPPQPYHAMYPITRAPTVRESASAAPMPPAALIPDYPKSGFIQTAPSRPRMMSPHTYWRTYGNPNCAPYWNEYASSGPVSEHYAFAPPARRGAPPLSYYGMTSQPMIRLMSRDAMIRDDCMIRMPREYAVTAPAESELFNDDEDASWVYQSYPSQFPAARERVIKQNQMPFPGPRLSRSRPATTTGGSPGQMLHPDCPEYTAVYPPVVPQQSAKLPPPIVTPPKMASATMSHRSPDSLQKRDDSPPVEHMEGSRSSETKNERTELERGPETTMAETSDDAGLSDTFAHSSVHDLARHQPEVIGEEGETCMSEERNECVPKECVCQECQAVRRAHAAPPPSEKCARSPLEEPKGVRVETAPVLELTQLNGGSTESADTETREQEEICPMRQADMNEAGVATDAVGEESLGSWGSCSSSADVDPPSVKTRVDLWNKKIAESSPLPQKEDVQRGSTQKRKSPSCDEEEAEKEQVSPVALRSPVTETGGRHVFSAPESECLVACHADSEDQSLTEKKDSNPLSAEFAMDLLKMSAPQAQVSPSPTQVPRSPWCQPLEASPNVVPRRLITAKCSNTTFSCSTSSIDVSAHRQFSFRSDDVDILLQQALIKEGSRAVFHRLLKGFYAVYRRESETGNGRGATQRDPSDRGRSSFDSLSTGKLQAAVEELPYRVFCFVKVSLYLGNIRVAVLNRTEVLRNCGSKAIRKWLTPENTFFTQQRSNVGPTSHRRSSSCITSRSLTPNLPEGGQLPWRAGKEEPLSAFLKFWERESSGVHMEPNTDPVPSRIPRERHSFETVTERKMHRPLKRRASS